MADQDEIGANIPDVRLSSTKFEGQVAVVTGAASGIGKEVALLFAAQGARVILVDIDKTGLSEATGQIQSKGGKASFRECDVTNEGEVHATINETVEAHHKIDILAHIAGIYPVAPLLEVKIAEYRRIFSVNMGSCFFLTQAVLPHMQKAGYGRIVNTSSQSVVRPEPGLAIYTASKGAVAAFTRATAVEAGAGITANVLSPTLIATERTAQMEQAQNWFAKVKGQQVIKRNGRSSDVAHTVMYLASPESAFITGQVFDIGGGLVFT